MIYILKIVESDYDSYAETSILASKQKHLVEEYVTGINSVINTYRQVVDLVDSDYMPKWIKNNPKPPTKFVKVKDIATAAASHYLKQSVYKQNQIKELFDANMFVDTLEYFFMEVDK